MTAPATPQPAKELRRTEARPLVPVSDGRLTDPLGADPAQAALTERIRQLERLEAEYDHYRRHVRRQRSELRERTVAELVSALLPVLDTVDQARVLADLGGFEAAAATLFGLLADLGLDRFGAVGDHFDPERHEALSATESDQVDGPTCVQVLRPGYRLGDRLLRPADVVVAQPPARGPQNEDLRVLLPIRHGQQSQGGELLPSPDQPHELGG